jgi:hypothetical protein
MSEEHQALVDRLTHIGLLREGIRFEHQLIANRLSQPTRQVNAVVSRGKGG